jgi:hypothetical protein
VKIKVIDNLAPEDAAMIQALYSRSPASVDDHLKKLDVKGSGNFMDRYYVGYGHASIGDCGVTAIFIEGVSMLTAKAIQDWPLYSGQEASTRYMDFSKSEFYDPIGNAATSFIQEQWRDFYMRAREPVLAHLREKYPRQDDEDPKVYDRAINARSFDILRSFLPAGAMTNLSWTTNLRQANDKLRWLIHHPERNAFEVAERIVDELIAKYEHSFNHRTSLKAAREGGDNDAINSYMRSVMKHEYFITAEDLPPVLGSDTPKLSSTIRKDDLRRYGHVLNSRPKGAELPGWLAELGNIRSEFALDFGSYRDLQRHRNGTIRMPLLSTDMGFHSWYLEQLPDDLLQEAAKLISEQTGRIGDLKCSEHSRQNYIAMGFRVPCRVTQGLPAFVYRLELRAGKTVHPTLRNIVLEEARWLEHNCPNLALYIDYDPDSWTVRRGQQTITEKA